MKKYNLWLEVEEIDDVTDETTETGLMPVKIYTSKSLSRVLYYGIKLIRKVGVVGDYADWITAHRNKND